MKKYDDNLFKMGEITKILGVTRKTLLVYENMGLSKTNKAVIDIIQRTI